jgi:gliding motility-associated-like protein
LAHVGRWQVWLLIIGLVWAWAPVTQAQLDSRDCLDAIQVCQNTYVQNTPPNGEGSDPDEIDGANSCLASGEINGAWYEFTIQSPGLLMFNIVPQFFFDDYDFGLYNLTTASCEDIRNIASLEVSCNYCGALGTTGINPGGTSNSQGAGGGCTLFNAPIPVQAGDRFVLYVSNFSGSIGGYTLDFSNSTATLFDNVPPGLESLQDTVACGTSTLNFRFDERIACNSGALANLTLLDPAGQSLSITALTSDLCAQGASAAQEFTLTLADPLSASGTYTLIATGGFLDACGNQLTTDTVTGLVNLSSGFLANAGPDQPLCDGQTQVQLQGSGTGPTGVALQYIWSPSTGLSDATIPNPVATITSGAAATYTLRVGDGQCFSPPDQVRIFSQPLPVGTINGATVVCQGRPSRLLGTGAERYRWFPFGIEADSLVFVPTDPATEVLMVPITAGCEGDTVRTTITLAPLPDPRFTIVPLNPCIGDTVIVSYNGTTDPDSALFFWSFGSAQILSGSGPGPWQIRWNLPIVADDIILDMTTGSNCTNKLTQTIEVRPRPTVDAGPNLDRCPNDPGVTLQGTAQGAAGCAILWTPSAGLSNASLLNPVASPSVTTTYYLQALCGACNSNIDSVTVLVLPQPIGFVNNPVERLCEGSAGIQLQAGAAGGMGRLRYRWDPALGLSNPFALQPIANPQVTTVYRLTVIDSMGCQSTPVPITVQVNPLPVANAGPDVGYCSDEPGVQLQPVLPGGVPGQFLYSWSPATGLSAPSSPAPFASPNQTTIYQLTITDVFSGCSSAATGLDTASTVTVSVLPRPVANAGPDRFLCPGDSVLIGDVPSGGSGYTYSWSPTTGLSNPTAARPAARPAATTTYFLTVSSFGCLSKADTVTVFVETAPTVAVARPFVETCGTDSVQLEAITTAGTGFSFRWTPATGLSDPTSRTPLARPSQTTVYQVVALRDGCASSAPAQVTVVVVAPPVVDADSLTTDNERRICQGQSLQLVPTIQTPDPFTVQWSSTDGPLPQPGQQRPVVQPSQTTKYYLTISTAYCTVIDSVTVEVLPAINATLTADTTTICQGQETVLRATGGVGSARFLWTPSTGLSATEGALIIARPDTTTTYTLIAREGGCADTLSVTINVNPTPTAALGQSAARGCGEVTVSFADSSQGATAWSWDFGDGTLSNQQNPSHTYTQPGVYTVRLRVIAPGRCIDEVLGTTEINLGEPLLADFATDFAWNDTLTLPGAVVKFVDLTTPNANAWLWQFGDGGSSTEQNPTYQYTQVGRFVVQLIVTNARGCTDTTRKGFVNVTSPLLDFYNVFTPNGDGLNDRFVIPYTGVEPYKLWIYDRWGHEVFSTTNSQEFWDGTYQNNGKPAPNGWYVFLLEIAGKPHRGQVTLLR